MTANVTGDERWRQRTGLAAFLVFRDLCAAGVNAEIADAVCVAIKRQFDIIDQIGSLAFGGDQVGAIMREMKKHYRRAFGEGAIQEAFDLAMGNEHFRRLV